MQGLHDGSLLLWHGDGRAQWRDASGALGAVQRLPLQAIRDVQTQEGGFVASGRDPATGAGVVLSLSATGQETQRKLLTPREAAAVLIHGEGAAIECGLTDRSRLHAALGHCERGGPEPWAFNANFLARPLRCGSVLAVMERGPQSALVLRSVATGQALLRQLRRAAAPLACVDGHHLLVGGQGLALLDLPSGQTLWTRKIIGGSVVDVAAAGGRAFWRVRGHAEVFVAPLR